MEQSTEPSPAFERKIKIITAGATVVGAAALVIAALQLVTTAFQFKDEERTHRLERTYKFMDDASNALSEGERKQLVIQFPGRWEKEVKFCLSREQADGFLRVALDADRDSPKPGEDSEQYRRWDLARKHLNQAEILAFSYYHNLVDREILARSACASMVKSNKYFKQLVEVFGVYLGGSQSWQVIPRAVEIMERDYGERCASFDLKQDPQKVAHDLPKPREEPAKGEEHCRN